MRDKCYKHYCLIEGGEADRTLSPNRKICMSRRLSVPLATRTATLLFCKRYYILMSFLYSTWSVFIGLSFSTVKARSLCLHTFVPAAAKRDTSVVIVLRAHRAYLMRDMGLSTCEFTYPPILYSAYFILCHRNWRSNVRLELVVSERYAVLASRLVLWQI